MNLRRPDIPIETVTSLALAAVILMIAAWAGMVTAKIGNAFGDRVIYYVAVFSLFIAGGIVMITRREPMRFAFLALIIILPIAATAVPPGRLSLTIFDVVMIALTIGLIGNRLLTPSEGSKFLFPTLSLRLAWLLLVPCVVFSQFPLISLKRFIEMFAVYGFFLFALAELKRKGGMERLVLLLSIVTIVMALGIFFEHFTHILPRMGSAHINHFERSAGISIYRSSGFFYDSQGAGAFLSCILTFFAVLSVRGWSTSLKMRVVLWIAITLGSIALTLTYARAAILSYLAVTIIMLFCFNRWNIAIKLIFIGIAAILAVSALLLPVDTWLYLFPAALRERLYSVPDAYRWRALVWFDTWDMFSDNPITGIGLGSFRSYLISTRPGVFNFYGIGTAQGVEYIPGHAENGYLTLLYEGGVLASIALLVGVGDALRRAFAIVAGRSALPQHRTEGIAALAGLATFGGTFMTAYTLGDERTAAIFAFLIAVIWCRSLQGTHVSPSA